MFNLSKSNGCTDVVCGLPHVGDEAADCAGPRRGGERQLLHLPREHQEDPLDDVGSVAAEEPELPYPCHERWFNNDGLLHSFHLRQR